MISHGRWVIEAKASDVEIEAKDIEQAHTYAAHPEVRAIYYLVTNGRRFVLCSPAVSEEPILEWTSESKDSLWLNIQNLLSPAAIMARCALVRPAPGKALGPGIDAEAKLVGGLLTYTRYECEDSRFSDATSALVGHRAAVLGNTIAREPDGMIRTVLRLAGPTPEWDRLNKIVGYENYEFRTADEYLSCEPSRPTIFQSMIDSCFPAGTRINEGILGVPSGGATLPFQILVNAFTQAAGFLTGRQFVGEFVIEYTFRYPEQVRQAGFNPIQRMHCGGEFEIQVQ